MYERYTERARQVIRQAEEKAAEMGSSQYSSEHILLGLLSEVEGVAAIALQNMGIDLDTLKTEILRGMKQADSPLSKAAPEPSLSSRQVLEAVIQEAQAMQVTYIGTEHLLLGVVREKEGLAAEVLSDMGVDLDRARAEVYRLMGGTPLK